MGQRECILPLSKLFVIASGAAATIDITDSVGNPIYVNYCTLIDVSSSTDTPTAGWMRMGPGPPDSVGYYQQDVVGTAHTGGTLAVQASCIGTAFAIPGVIGAGGTPLVLSTQTPFNKVLVENALFSDLTIATTLETTCFCLTYGHITHANTIKDQQRNPVS